MDANNGRIYRGETEQEAITSCEAAEQSVHWTGGDSVWFCELHQISFLQAECPRCHPASQ